MFEIFIGSNIAVTVLIILAGYFNHKTSCLINKRLDQAGL